MLSLQLAHQAILVALVLGTTHGEKRGEPHFRLLSTGANRIVGGDPALEGEIPWQVSVQDFFGRHLCGGSIISPHYIVTAAHCSEYPPFFYSIVAGTIDNQNHESTLQVLKLHTHPRYDPYTLEHDISVWKISPPFAWSNSVRPIALPVQGAEIPAGMELTVSGWGWTGAGNGFGEFPRELQKVSVAIIDKAECNRTYLDIGGISQTNVCAGQDGKDSCGGDSGGPLFDAGVLYGIVSWGPNFGCAIPDFPGVYTEVSGYADWLTQFVEKPAPCNIKSLKTEI